MIIKSVLKYQFKWDWEFQSVKLKLNGHRIMTAKFSPFYKKKCGT